MFGTNQRFPSTTLVSVIALLGLLLVTAPPHVASSPDAPHGAGPSAAPAAHGLLSLATASPSVLAGPDRGETSDHEPLIGLSGPTPLQERPFSIVNPKQYYSSEPAPMGIADFGVTGAGPGASAYQYSSTSFQGEAHVASMSVVIPGSASTVTAFELNGVLFLQRDGVNYSYWIQNGLHLDASSDQFSIGGAYVWNFSSPTARLSVGELQGAAGSVLATDTYYFIPSCGASFPGQCTQLSLPATLLGRILSSTNGGIPYVAYQYNIGSGWVTYDNVSFPHMAGASDPGFRVSGFAPTPIAPSLYYDIEWVWAGAGGGGRAVDQGSDIDLHLGLWNGHNYQSVPTAWNFGSNTGETSSNVSDLPASGSGVGPSAHLASGPGTLAVLYNRTDVGFLNLSVPTLEPATVLVDGGSVPFHGGWANLTLNAGTHSIYLQNYSNASAQFDIASGATTGVNLSGAGRVAFTESGLPTGTTWGVTVNGTLLAGPGATLVLNLPNGTYPLAVATVPGFHPNASSPTTVTLPGPSTIAIDFAPFTYAVTFTESGLPDATPWWVNASGTRVEGTSATLLVSATNGSTPYETGSLYEFIATPPTGTIDVTGGLSFPVTVEFAYRPTFIVGIVVPSGAEVSIGGVNIPLVGGIFNYSVTAGTYLLVASATGYSGRSFDVTATAGNVTWANVTLVANETPTTQPSPDQSNGGAIPLGVAALVVVGVAVSAAAVLLYLKFRRR
ncbi:MAG TPA: thermopsin family protease [Thermoplasmata archaeon]